MASSQASLSLSASEQVERSVWGESDRATEATCDSLTTAKVSFSALRSAIYGHTPSSLVLNCNEHGEQRHVYEHTAALQAKRRTSNQRRVGGWKRGDKMFTTEADDWILISHSTFTRCTSLPQTRQVMGTLLLKMTCCQTWRTDTPSSPLCSTFNFYSVHSVTHCDT